jgi:uncharacterized membrane protein
MATANPLGGNTSITLERNKVITITKRTVRFSKNVYQTCNITGLSEGEVDVGTIPWIIIIGAFGLSPIVGFSSGAVGSLFVLAAISGVVWNFVKPKHYGLLLTLNSGDKKLFVTTDTVNLQRVIEEIANFIESDKGEVYQISINNSQIQGNFVQGNVGGSMMFKKPNF